MNSFSNTPNIWRCLNKNWSSPVKNSNSSMPSVENGNEVPIGLASWVYHSCFLGANEGPNTSGFCIYYHGISYTTLFFQNHLLPAYVTIQVKILCYTLLELVNRTVCPRDQIHADQTGIKIHVFLRMMKNWTLPTSRFQTNHPASKVLHLFQ